jgi:zinc transporter ZupT
MTNNSFYFWQMFLITSSLPIFSYLISYFHFKLIPQNIKKVFGVIGVMILSYAIVVDLIEHSKEAGVTEYAIGGFFALIAYVIMIKSHKHTHKKEVGGLVVAELVHGLLDGVVIGVAYFLNPLTGLALALGVIVHEFPKILGTISWLNNVSGNRNQAALNALICQLGVPLGAVVVYSLGREINEEYLHLAEFAATGVLMVILLRLSLHVFKHDLKHHSHH